MVRAFVRPLKLVCQVSLLFAISALGELIASSLHWPIPGSMVGMAALFVMLRLGIVQLDWVAAGGDWLLANLLLFIVPSAVGVMRYANLVRQGGLSLLAVIAASTAAVMLASGATAEGLDRLRHRRGGSRRW